MFIGLGFSGYKNRARNDTEKETDQQILSSIQLQFAKYVVKNRAFCKLKPLNVSYFHFKHKEYICTHQMLSFQLKNNSDKW